MKILILKPSSLGDVVQALPVLRILKRHNPQSQIYWWLSSELFPLLEGDPDLAGIYPFHRRGFAKIAYWRDLTATIRKVRSERFEWVIDLQGLARSGFLSWIARGNLTIGLDDSREGAPGFYDLAVPRQSFHMHAIDWYLSVLTVLAVPIRWDFAWLPVREATAVQLRHTWQVDGQKWVIINPGARWTNKRWPVEYYRELVRLLADSTTDLRFAILGSIDDQAIGARIAEAQPDRCLDLTGKTSLPEMVEWIRLSVFMVTNDTGPMHVAAALAKPVVALFGPTEPRRTGPYNQVENTVQIGLPCVPCLKSACGYVKPLECLRAIQPLTVFERATALLLRDRAQPNDS